MFNAPLYYLDSCGAKKNHKMESKAQVSQTVLE